MPATMQKSPDMKVIESCDYGKQFAEIFYEKLDKGRHTILKLYHEQSTAIWNGHCIQGNANIAAFIEKLPTTDTTLLSIDSQPVEDLPQIAGKKMLSVLCAGKMKFSSGSNLSNFTESFVLIAETENDSQVWKIISDVYRTH